MEELQGRFEYASLSKKVDDLRSFMGRKIIKIDKVFFYEPDEYSSRDKLNQFKYEGTVILTFQDGDEYSFFGDEGGSNSICMRLEKINRNIEVGGQVKLDRYIFDDKDIVSIISVEELGDIDYALLLSQKIVAINILTTSNLSPKERCVPSDKGLEFIFENGKKLILSHNLTEDNFVFGVLTEKDKISSNTIVKLSVASNI